MVKYKHILIFALCLTTLLGSSGHIKEFYGGRNIIVNIADNNSSYIAFTCQDTVHYLNKGDSFYSMMITNNLGKDAEFYLSSPQDMLTFSNPTYISDGDSEMITATYNGDQGDHEIPINVYAVWDGGSATLRTCSVHVVCSKAEIEKILLKGNTTVPLKTKEFWTFRILVKSYGDAKNYTIKDTIPGEFEIASISASSGNYLITQTGKAKHVMWYVKVTDEEYLDVTIYTTKNPAGKQEFTSEGYYSLNDGAEIIELGIKSNPIYVRAMGDG